MCVCGCVCQYFQTSSPLKPLGGLDPPWDGGTKVCSNGPGDMAAMPVYDKNLKKSSTLELKGRKLGMQHRVLEYYQVYSNDDTRLTLIYFTARTNLVPYAFFMGKR